MLSLEDVAKGLAILGVSLQREVDEAMVSRYHRALSGDFTSEQWVATVEHVERTFVKQPGRMFPEPGFLLKERQVAVRPKALLEAPRDIEATKRGVENMRRALGMVRGLAQSMTWEGK